MANVKISNLPIETTLANMTGIAGYNASGTAQISGATIDSAFAKSNSGLQFIVDNSNVVDSNAGTGSIIFSNSGSGINTTVSVNSISSNTSFSISGSSFNPSIPGLTFNSGGELRITPNASLGTPAVGDVLAAKNVLGDVEWVSAGGSTPTLQQVLDSSNTADSNGNTGTIVLTNSANNRTATYGNENISTTTSSFGIDVNGSNNGINIDADDGAVRLGTSGTKFIILDGRVNAQGQSNQFDPGSGLTSTWSLFNSNYLLDGYNSTSGAGGDIRINSRGTLTMHTGNLSTSTPGGALSIYARGNTASLSTIDGSTIGGNVTISSSSGDVIITGGENLVLTNTGLGTPAVGDVLTASTTGGIAEWTTPSSGGGGGYTTLTSAASTVWDGSNGLSASWQPTVTTPFNTLDMSSGFSAGDRGSLIIDVSTTTNFILPSNSKAADGDISVSGVNKTILDYVYDGTNFYWSNRKNMIDPIYLPTVATNDLVSFYIPSQYQGLPGNVPIGNAWINSYTSNNLVGDLSRVGSTSSTQIGDVQFVAKDDVNEVPAHFLMGSDGSTSSYWNVASALGGNVLGGSWTGALWFKTIPTTSSSFHGMMDPDKDDDESIYIFGRRLYIEGPNLYTNFPSFEPATTGGNDNAFSLEDEWIYVSVSFDHPNNTMSVILACQATLDNAGGTILGYDGSNINISADGTYQETLSATLIDNTWDDFAYGASVTTGGTAFAFEGGLGLAAVYGTNITDTLAISNWNSTKQYYYIS